MIGQTFLLYSIKATQACSVSVAAVPISMRVSLNSYQGHLVVE